MKQIELTREHKSKLLEMCKILFHEYEDIDLFSKDQEGNYNGERCFIYFDDYYIHWFEFVMTHLVSKIQEKLPEHLIFRDQPHYVGNIFNWKKGNRWSMYTEFFFLYPKNTRVQHPVDYLYNEFQKIKKMTTYQFTIIVEVEEGTEAEKETLELRKAFDEIDIEGADIEFTCQEL